MLHLRRNGSGPALLYVHGLGGSGLLFQPVVQRLGTGFDHLRPDLLGYGRSPKPAGSYTVDVHVDALRATVAAAGVDEPVVLVGLSMGSILALEYAVRWPESVRGLVVCAMPYYRDEAEARRDLRPTTWAGLSLHRPRLARATMTPLLAAGRRNATMSKLLTPSLYDGEVARESMMASYPAFAASLRECLVQQRVVALLDETAGIPKEVVHGSEDRWCPASRVEAVVASRPECRFEVLDGVGHNTVVIDPVGSTAAVTRLLGRLAS